MGLFQRLLRRDDGVAATLYARIVERARAPHWYIEGDVPDTIDGRFDTVAMVLTFVLLRLEQAPEGAAPAVRLTERFITDMDGQLREIGIGDLVVGKHVGRMMGMLGGRLTAVRAGLAEGSLDAALTRNLYRGADPGAAALAHVREALADLRVRLEVTPVAALAEGALP